MELAAEAEMGRTGAASMLGPESGRVTGRELDILAERGSRCCWGREGEGGNGPRAGFIPFIKKFICRKKPHGR